MKGLFDGNAEWSKSLATYLEERAEWVIRGYSAKDESEILKLFETVFQRALNVGEWKWKYFRSPSAAPLIQVAAECGSENIIGHQACIQKTLQVKDREVKLFMIVDSAILPAFQRTGLHAHLILKLSAQVVEERGVMLGLPNENAYSSLIKLGAIKVATLQPWVKILKAGKYFKKYDRTGLISAALKVAGDLRVLAASCKRALFLNREKKVLKVEGISHFDEKLDDLWDRVSPHFSVRVRRDKEYMNWRYGRNPQRKYKVLAAVCDNRWMGYIVLAAEERDGCRFGIVVDLVFDPSLPAAGRLLLREAYRYCRENNAAALTGIFSCPDFYSRALGGEGFFKVPEKILDRHFHVLADSQTLGPALSEPHLTLVRDGRSWFFSMGDTDLV